MVTISSGGLHCPVCGEHDMYEEIDWDDVLYWCSTCGYRTEFKIVEDKNGNKCFKHDARSEKRKFAKWVDVEKKHGLGFIGKKVPFYPEEHEVNEEEIV